MRWWILGAVLAGWAAAIAAGGFAGAAEPLRLELEAERLWCTAGTVTVVRWEVSGGVEPYALTVHGEERPGASGAARLDCPELAARADGETPAWGEMTVPGEATDAAGGRARASARVLIARKLDAPKGLELGWWSPNFNVFWEPVAGAGSLARVESCGRNNLPCGPYLLRYRAVGAADWRYEQAPPKFGRIPWERNPAGAEEMQIAAMRHPIEAQRPEGLNWSGLVRYAATRHYGVMTLQASADQISANWEEIPVNAATLELSGPGGTIAREYRRAPEDDRWRIHRERFDGLEADSEYVLRVAREDSGGIKLAVRTAPLPPTGGTPIRLELSPGSGGRGSCTAGTDMEVEWAVTGGRGPYRVEIAEASGEGERGAVRIKCGPAPQGGGGGLLGYAPRMVRGTVTDSAGARAEAELRLLAGPPLAPPRVEAPKTSHGGFYVPFWIRASRIDYPSWRVAMRWRAAGGTEWSYNVDGIANGPWEDLGWANGWVNTSGMLSDATVFETQVARVRDSREIEHPEALAWTEIAKVTTASEPVGLVAESTHDSISLSWGPQVEGLNYIATLNPFPPGEEQQPTVRFGYDYEPRGYAATAQPYGIAWNNLCPGTQYFAAVRSDAASNGEWDAPIGLLITTEPALGGTVAPPQFVAAAAEPERITLRWAENGCVPDSEYRVSVREYGTGFAVARDESQRREFKRSEEVHEITGLRPGSTYEIALQAGWGSPAGDSVLVVETPDRTSELPSDAEPPEFDVKHGQWHLNRSSPWFRITPRADVQGDVELEWHMGGRRLRRLASIEEAGAIDVAMVPDGWYEFRMRGFDAEGRPTRWSEPVRAATTPSAPWIASVRHERGYLIVTWDEPEGGIPIDRYIVEWRTDGTEWQGIEVGTGGWGAIPNAPLLDAEEAQVRLRAVSGEYGAGEPSGERDAPRSLIRDWSRGIDARGCAEDGSGMFSFAWHFREGIAPFTLRARPINLDAGASGIAEVETMDREGRVELRCADGMEERDGELYAGVAIEISEYGRPPQWEEAIYRIRFGSSTAWSGYDHGRTQLGQRYGEVPVPGGATQSVHAEHVKWNLGLSVQTRQRWMARTRTEAEPDWAERELHYGSWPMGWWFVDGLEPGTRYEYAFGRYFDGGNEWSETGVVTTLGEVTGIAVSEEGDAVVVEWDAQPDAWKYAVRLRGAGRSWWTVHDATEGERERAAFAGAAGHRPYAAEVITPPKDAAGEDESTFQLYQGPH